MKKILIPLVILLVASYGALAILTFTCLDRIDSQHVGHHHDQGGVVHSSFCAWACQSSPASVLIATAPTIRPMLLLFPQPVLLATTAIPAPSIFIPARGPPR